MMMKRNRVETWADGFGVWHAKVTLAVATPSDTLPIDNVRRVARRAIKRELMARQSLESLYGYKTKIMLDKCDLRADNRIYSVSFIERV